MSSGTGGCDPPCKTDRGGLGAALTDEVSTEIVVTGNGVSGRGRTTVLRLAWRRADPLAVSLTLMTQPDHPALPRGSWVLLRDFLRYGLDEPTGDGNVRLRPDASRTHVVLELARASRPCSVTVACDRVRAFLDATEQIVPAGEEASEEAIDALIARLLSR